MASPSVVPCTGTSYRPGILNPGILWSKFQKSATTTWAKEAPKTEFSWIFRFLTTTRGKASTLQGLRPTALIVIISIATKIKIFTICYIIRVLALFHSILVVFALSSPISIVKNRVRLVQNTLRSNESNQPASSIRLSSLISSIFHWFANLDWRVLVGTRLLFGAGSVVF